MAVRVPASRLRLSYRCQPWLRPVLVLMAVVLPLREAVAAGVPKDKARLVRSARSGPWSAPATWEGGGSRRGRPGPGPRGAHGRLRRRVRSRHPLDPRRRHARLRPRPRHAARRRPDQDPGRRRRQRGRLRLRRPCRARYRRRIGPGPPWRSARPTGRSAASHTAVIRLVYVDGMDPADLPGHRLLRRPDGLPRRAAEPHLGQARADGPGGRARRSRSPSRSPAGGSATA